MSEAEREFMKKVDDTILNASGKTLKKLQELDMKTQLHLTTFYDAYVTHQAPSKKENTGSKPRAFRKSK